MLPEQPILRDIALPQGAKQAVFFVAALNVNFPRQNSVEVVLAWQTRVTILFFPIAFDVDRPFLVVGKIDADIRSKLRLWLIRELRHKYQLTVRRAAKFLRRFKLAGSVWKPESLSLNKCFRNSATPSIVSWVVEKS